MQDHGIQLPPESFIWALHAMCQVCRVPFSADLVLRDTPPPYTLTALESVADALGLKSGVRAIAYSQLREQPLPCLALLTKGAAVDAPKPAGAGPRTVTAEVDGVEPQTVRVDSPGDATTPPCVALVLRCDNTRVLLMEQGRGAPASLGLTEFEARYLGTVVLFKTKGKGNAVNDPDAQKPREFGFQWFIPELLRHKGLWREVLIASFVMQVMALGTPIFTQVIIDKVVVHHTVNTLVVIGVALGIFVIFTAGLSWLRQYLVLHTGNRIDAVLGTQVFQHLFRLPMPYFGLRPTGTLVARIQGVETIREFITGAAVVVMLDFPFLLIFLGVMFYYSVSLTLVTLAILTIIAALSFAITPVLRDRLNQQFLLGARNQALVTEYISGMETVKSLQMEPQVWGRYGDYLSAYLAAGFNTRQLANTYNVVANALEQALTLMILCFGAWLVMTTQSLTIGMLVAFQMFASRLSGPMLRLAGLWQEFQQADIAVRRLGDIMNAPQEPHSLRPAREGGGGGKIEIRDLSFRYAENLPYLYRGFNLTIETGRCLALMGPSGSGKSTLAKLLLGFYVPTDGVIMLDGRDMRYLPANELRSYFGVVPQDTVLFSGTIYDNLIVANPLVTFDHAVEACKIAEIHETIERLPNGYQTAIGEHGAGLSGGQKQRVAIARALLKRPRILIFDEATAALDEPTAESFALTVNQLRGKVGMIFIAHQLPRSLLVDEVVKVGST